MQRGAEGIWATFEQVRLTGDEVLGRFLVVWIRRPGQAALTMVVLSAQPSQFDGGLADAKALVQTRLRVR